MNPAERIHVIDSHTGGEPTRTVLSGGPLLGEGPLAQRVETFRTRFDHYRSAIVNEPRGSDVFVGALLCRPLDDTCITGVIFFNNTGYLGMCGHGTIGVVATLQHLGRITCGVHRIETPVGVVSAELHAGGAVTLTNVASYRTLPDVTIDVEGFGAVRGEVAWGGNWFFLTGDCPLPLTLDHVDALTQYAVKIREALAGAGITGPTGEEIDHIEISGAPTLPGVDSKNFVLCPGRSYDRSPCGTGTSAKLACLQASGRLSEGALWVQQSITDSIFEACYSLQNGDVIPRIKGRAFVNAEAALVLASEDPLQWGIRR